jgi:hypothetical protein
MIYGFLMAIALLSSGPDYTPKTSITLVITIYSTGDQKLWTYTLENRRISVTRHFPDGRRDMPVFRRDLTVDEAKRLDRYFRGFSLHELKKEYIDTDTGGDSYTCYHIKINTSAKDVYVFYARPDKLLNLNRVINRLLPQQYHLWD